MTKEINETQDQAKTSRVEKQSNSERLQGLKELRAKGVLTRQQFRLLTWDKGLQGSVKGVPMYTDFASKDVSGKRVPQEGKLQQWTRI